MLFFKNGETLFGTSFKDKLELLTEVLFDQCLNYTKNEIISFWSYVMMLTAHSIELKVKQRKEPLLKKDLVIPEKCNTLTGYLFDLISVLPSPDH